MNYRKILKSGMVTEKSNKLVETENKYTFKVAASATKGQIKIAIESLYGVKVINVNVLKNRGRIKRSLVGRRLPYKTKDTKKAIVQLDSKDTLELYKGGAK